MPDLAQAVEPNTCSFLAVGGNLTFLLHNDILRIKTFNEML